MPDDFISGMTIETGEILARMDRDTRLLMSEREKYRRGEGGGDDSFSVYKATADESGGEITVKLIDSAGVVSGDEITAVVLP